MSCSLSVDLLRHDGHQKLGVLWSPGCWARAIAEGSQFKNSLRLLGYQECLAWQTGKHGWSLARRSWYFYQRLWHANSKSLPASELYYHSLAPTSKIQIHSIIGMHGHFLIVAALAVGISWWMLVFRACAWTVSAEIHCFHPCSLVIFLIDDFSSFILQQESFAETLVASFFSEEAFDYLRLRLWLLRDFLSSMSFVLNSDFGSVFALVASTLGDFGFLLHRDFAAGYIHISFILLITWLVIQTTKHPHAISLDLQLILIRRSHAYTLDALELASQPAPFLTLNLTRVACSFGLRLEYFVVQPPSLVSSSWILPP